MGGSKIRKLAEIEVRNLPVIPNVWMFLRYLRRFFEKRRRDPRNDLATALITTEEAGDKLSRDELLAMSFFCLCGSLLLLGLLTRLAAIPLIINMVVAIISIKIPILLGHGFWGFSLRQLPYYGFWGMDHEARTDFAMLLGSIFLLIVGGGVWSIDRWLVSKANRANG